VEASQRVENVVLDNFDDNTRNEDSEQYKHARRIIVNDKFDGNIKIHRPQTDNDDQDDGQLIEY
jgi:hypothetical protein